jgi:molybdopterin synthase catalytic subunit
MRIRTAIVTGPILPERVLQGFTSSQDGACLLFLGVVRDHNQGKAVSSLEYETYREMAEGTLSDIASEACRRFDTDRIAVLHRVGTLEVGEVSTAIAVATPHREEAYQASRYLIEELKARVPVWKREHYAEGDSGWIEAQDDGGCRSGEGEGGGEENMEEMENHGRGGGTE